MKDNNSLTKTAGKTPEQIIYNLLSEVYTRRAYSTIALDEALTDLEPKDRAYITRVFYGVIEQSVAFDYIIDILCDKKPKNSVIILIKMGLYLLRETSTPDYAAVGKTVALAKAVGKAANAGFINAILRKSQTIDLKAQKFDSTAQRFSVLYSYPLWATALLIREMGEENAQKFLSTPRREGTHIRPNLAKTTEANFDQALQSIAAKSGAKIQKTPLGYYVPHEVMRSLPANHFTAQSYASILAAKSYLTDDEAVATHTVLDLCGAPGGKSIYLAGKFPHLAITCCDIHPHKIQLIESYAKRMGAKITAMQNDATVFKSQWQQQFDLVICDVPCSGLGLTSSKPDIILGKSEEDIKALSELQLRILTTAAAYAKKGGTLCYSTCTITKQENQAVVDNFLSKNDNFYQVPITNGITDNQPASEATPKADNQSLSLQLLPQTHGCDGFFIAKMKKK